MKMISKVGGGNIRPDKFNLSRWYSICSSGWLPFPFSLSLHNILPLKMAYYKSTANLGGQCTIKGEVLAYSLRDLWIQFPQVAVRRIRVKTLLANEPLKVELFILIRLASSRRSVLLQRLLSDTTYRLAQRVGRNLFMAMLGLSPYPVIMRTDAGEPVDNKAAKRMLLTIWTDPYQCQDVCCLIIILPWGAAVAAVG